MFEDEALSLLPLSSSLCEPTNKTRCIEGKGWLVSIRAYGVFPAAPFLIRTFVKAGTFHRLPLFEGTRPATDEQQIFTWYVY